MTRTSWLTVIPVAAAAAVAFAHVGSAVAQDKVLKVGSLGVMSGPLAGWGGVMCQTAQTYADMRNAAGGLTIGGETHMIEIVCYDTRQDPKVAQTGAERLIQPRGDQVHSGTQH